MYSRLLLSAGTDPNDSGSMVAGEVLRLPLNARVVVLSECETALGQSTGGGQLFGMGWALTRGRGGIGDQPMEGRFGRHRGVDGGVPPQSAQVFDIGRIAAARSIGSKESAGPPQSFYWAAFVVLGDGFL